MSADGRNLVEFLEDELPKAVTLAFAETLAKASDLGFFAVPGPEVDAAVELGNRIVRRFVIERARREEFREAVECGDYDCASRVIGDLIADGGPKIDRWRAMKAKLEPLRASRDRGRAGGA
jgi:hypothetical protein